MDASELTEEQHITFSVLYGTIFSMSLVSEYTHGLQAIIEARGNNYLLNKAKSAEKANDVLLDVLLREFTKTLSADQKAVTLAAIEEQKAFVFDLFYLDATEQHRVKNLVSKLKRDRK